MSEIIYDANFLVAFIDKNDKWHKKAIDIHEEIKARDFGIVYFDCVANEVINVLGKSLEELEEKGMAIKLKEVMSRFKGVVSKDKPSWIYPHIVSYYDEILTLMADSGGRLNFHDAPIALVPKENEFNCEPWSRF